jgi:hypothetical protein
LTTREEPFGLNVLDIDRPPVNDSGEKFFCKCERLFEELKLGFFERGIATKREFLYLGEVEKSIKQYAEALLNHCYTVAVIAASLAMQDDKNSREQFLAFSAGFLHDIGKRKLNWRILWPPKELDGVNYPSEYVAAARTHALRGYRILMRHRLSLAKDCAIIALLHHRHQGASSYPTDEVLEELGVTEPHEGLWCDILQYVEVADNIDASKRHSFSLDESGNRVPPPPRQELCERIKRRMPHLAHHIDRAFDGVIVV